MYLARGHKANAAQIPAVIKSKELALTMFMSFFSRQARRPTGLFGRFFMSRFFEKGNAPLNALLIDLVAAGKDDRILEIGFGSGASILQIAKGLAGGAVEGVDISDAMIKAAVRKNKAHIAAGKVKLTLGDFDTIDYPENSFDTVCSANTIYFWPDQRATLDKIHNILKPGGKLVLGFMDKSRMETMPLDMQFFTPVSVSDVQALLEQAGFATVKTHALPKHEAMYCLEAYNIS